MKRVVLLACCLVTVCLAACPPTAKPPVPLKACRESDGPNGCKPPTGIGGHQGGYLEGDGLERLHFKVPAGVFPPAPNTKLKALESCGADSDLVLVMNECVPIPGVHGPGAFTCQVDVLSHTSGVSNLVPPLAPICLTSLSNHTSDPDASHHRGVTVARGFWDGSGAWQDEPDTVTLSCDANNNSPGKEQFEQADGAITKCMRQFQVNPQLFHDEFLACIRMARADYCGDGHPHTYGGTAVRVSTPQNPMTASECRDGMCFEASWSKNGAVCIARPRWTGPGMEFQACSDQFAPKGTLLCREEPAQGVVFSRSEQHVCKQQQPVACGIDQDPVCILNK